MLFGCSETGTGVLLELDGSGMVDTVDVAGMWDGALQKSGSTMGAPRSLPLTILIEMPARAVTARFSVTARLAGVVVGQGETPDVMVKPHQLAHVTLSLGGARDDLSMPDLAGADFSGLDLPMPDLADLAKGDLAQPPCSGNSRCGDAGVCNGFESGSIDPPWYSIVRTGCTATFDSTRACRGAKSLHLTLANTSGLIESFVFEKAILPAANTIYLRGFFYLPATFSFFTQLEMVYQSFSPYEQIDVQGNDDGTLQIDNSVSGVPSNHSALHLPLDRWVCVEMKVVSSASGSGSVTISVDGVPQNDITLTNITTEPSPALDTVSFGISENANATTVPAEEAWIDEVMVDTQPIGCNR
jgi:hypothetical protein